MRSFEALKNKKSLEDSKKLLFIFGRLKISILLHMVFKIKATFFPVFWTRTLISFVGHQLLRDQKLAMLFYILHAKMMTNQPQENYLLLMKVPQIILASYKTSVMSCLNASKTFWQKPT